MFDKIDIHIHFPAASIPKDGPSAGITITTALVSLITGMKIKSDLSMTGEITLKGVQFINNYLESVAGWWNQRKMFSCLSKWNKNNSSASRKQKGC